MAKSAEAGRAPEPLALAEHAAREAGRFLAHRAREGASAITESRRDVRLDVDRAAEDRIVSILESSSDIPVVAEERIADGGSACLAGRRWIVDPLDGTFNFHLGIPFCCVSVGLWQDDDPLVAAVYDFDRDEMFSAVVGQAAWLNGDVIRVRAIPPERAVLCTGFPVGTSFEPEAVSRFAGQVAIFRKIRMLGSAALSLAYVASGRADVYFERDIRIWDVAAGLALVQAAGGAFFRAPSRVPHAWTVYAHNGACPWRESLFA